MTTQMKEITTTLTKPAGMEQRTWDFLVNTHPFLAAHISANSTWCWHLNVINNEVVSLVRLGKNAMPDMTGAARYAN